jgi:hypothetical protein
MNKKEKLIEKLKILTEIEVVKWETRRSIAGTYYYSDLDDVTFEIVLMTLKGYGDKTLNIYKVGDSIGTRFKVTDLILNDEDYNQLFSIIEPTNNECIDKQLDEINNILDLKISLNTGKGIGNNDY